MMMRVGHISTGACPPACWHAACALTLLTYSPKGISNSSRVGMKTGHAPGSMMGHAMVPLPALPGCAFTPLPPPLLLVPAMLTMTACAVS